MKISILKVTSKMYFLLFCWEQLKAMEDWLSRWHVNTAHLNSKYKYHFVKEKTFKYIKLAGKNFAKIYI